MTNPQALILVVDDNADIRRTLEMVLKSQAYSVRCHASAEDYLAHPMPVGPRVMVLDVRMPGMDGPALQEHMRKTGDLTPVIFISGEHQLHESQAMASAASVTFLWKPFSTQELLDAVAHGLTLCPH